MKLYPSSFLWLEHSVMACQSANDRKLFNVYDKVGPEMIMSLSRSDLMICWSSLIKPTGNNSLYFAHLLWSGWEEF